MYDDFNYDHYYRQNRRPSGKRRILPTIALVLATSLISSLTVGMVLDNKFTAELERIRQQSADMQVAGGSAWDETRLSGGSSGGGSLSADTGTGAGAVGNGTAEASRDMTGEGLQLQSDADRSIGSIFNTAVQAGSTVTAIAKKAGPAIVGIRMTIAGTRYNYFGVSNDRVGEGSGIIISKDGYIMTNYHVVYGADPKQGTASRTILEVFLPDGREAKAVFKGGDEKTDLAVIKIDLEDLPTAELGDSSKLEVGELAVAIGNPLGMEFAGSVTVGVISALNRTIEINDRTLNLIQTDAAINQGNSGGALLNSQGQVIGINSAKIAASGVEGLGFAIPINDAWPIVDQLIRYGYVRGRPYIGISGREISSVYASYYGISKGIYVIDIVEGSGADKAGIKRGDIIVAIAGKDVESIRDLDKIKEAYKPGDTVHVTIDRSGRRMSLSLTFDEEK
ncbi:MAG: trypsin-like peptidase domain-containing protein [Acetivibrionales bacterium]|nr:trypsin-like peptidase domain-containing protein [Bacillota bacterium]HOA55200.1 trypsin-like peptidase domain-containing protein [Clostridiales bacterium]HQD30806.1 trypsin-like peptidase domain-containing protein [Clostridiales bacterium]